MYTKKQLDRLKELDVIQHFTTVINSQYKRGTFRHVDEEVADIYENASGKKIQRNFTCKSCVFNLYKVAGELYFESEKYYKQKNLDNLKKARTVKKQNKENNNNGTGTKSEER